MNKIFNALLIAATFVFLFACNSAKQETTQAKKEDFVIAFYNVENLFDTIDSPDTHDEEFTPDGRKQWNSKRYTDKLQKLSKVLAAINGEELPWAFGLCEVENKAVVEDLLAQPALIEGNYGIVHYESPDERGIDVAFVYQKDKMKVLKSEGIETPFSFDQDDKTREILYVYAQFTGTQTTAHVFINHWPSRSGGMEKSEPKRVAVAKFLKERTDAILKADPEAHIICLGDYNDEPNNNSVLNTLLAQELPEKCEDGQLYNLSYADFKAGLGSYHYWRETSEYDWSSHVSGQLVQGDKGLRLQEIRCLFLKKIGFFIPTMTVEKLPSKTYGKGYYGGYSDHLPVYLKLELVQ